MSRDYRGTTYHAHLRFTWPDDSRLSGQSRLEETDSADYEFIERWLLMIGTGVPYRVNDGERDLDVRVTRALIVPDGGCAASEERAAATPGAAVPAIEAVPREETPDTRAIAAALVERYIETDDPERSIGEVLRHARSGLAVETETTRAHLELATAAIGKLPTALVSTTRLAALRDLPARLAGRIIGQGRAITTVSESILRREVALGERRRPVGVFLFVGPTGVGKTELARALAIEHFGSEADLVRFDMGQYKEHHEALKLTGAPPSYVGHDAGGQLFNAFGSEAGAGAPWTQTRRRAVLLLDEFEKANTSIHDLFLAAFDYGLVAGSKGESLDLRDCIVIMTSNVGIREATDAADRRAIGFAGRRAQDRASDVSAARDRAMRERFSPEFRNRLDAVVEFSDLGSDDIGRILDLLVANYASSLATVGLGLVVGPRIRARMRSEAVASGMGARDLVLRRFPVLVEDLVTSALSGDLYRRGATFEIEEDASGAPELAVHAQPARSAVA